MMRQKYLKIMLIACTMGLTLQACKDKGGSTVTPTPTPQPAAYPKTVTVEYTITGSGVDTTRTLVYVNETGGNTALDPRVNLPFVKKFTRSVKQYDKLGLGASTHGSGSLKLTIKVDNTEVKSETFSGTSYMTGSIAYLFP